MVKEVLGLEITLPNGSKVKVRPTTGSIHVTEKMRKPRKMSRVPRQRKITAKEKAKGRSEDYWQKSFEDQWAEDKRLGILDWDGS